MKRTVDSDPIQLIEYISREAFGGGIHVRIECPIGATSRLDSYCVTETPVPGDFTIESTVHTYPLSSACVTSLLAALAEVEIPLWPPCTMGLDGCDHELVINSGFSCTHLKWWASAGESWQTVEAFIEQMLELIAREKV